MWRECAPSRAVVQAARVHGFPLIDDDDPATGAQEHLLDHVAVGVHATVLRREQTDGRRCASCAGTSAT